ncbi:S8 family serine peptidase [Longispora sp. K20-0274]|uniref:S8 family serine peptidase n=1 Tax=Longispora sp. K20-0274 TaxID=3088255 RepID=UPI003999BD36
MRGVGIWAVLVTCVLQVGGWIADEIPAALSLPRPPSWVWAMLCLVNAVLVFAPAELLSQRGRTPGARMAGQIWATAAVALALMGLARLVPIPHDELSLGSLAVLTGIVAVGVRVFRGWRSPEGRPSGWAVAVGLACLLPWLVFGALGGRLETAMAVLAGIATGALARSVLDGRFWAAYKGDQFLAGSVAGVALCVLAAGVGAFGINLLELAVLPPLGYVAARLQHTWLLVAIAALGPLAFVDPEEMSFVLGFSDVLFYSVVSALCSLAIAAVAGFVLPRTLRRGFAAALVMTVVAGSAYALLGSPDFYGNRLFVIMKAQAQVQGLAGPVEVHRRLVDTAESSQADLRALLTRKHIPFTPYYLVNALELDGGPVLRLRLAARADVDRVLISQRLRPIRERGEPDTGTPGPLTGPTWDIRNIGADRVWQDLGVRGAGTLVGHIDTGADAGHPALAGGFRGGTDSWFDPWYGTGSPQDLDGHGTGTASLAVGRGGVGVAPDARWIGCSTGAHGKLALLALAHGLDPEAVGGRKLLTELAALQEESGRYSDKSEYGNFSNTLGQSFAVLALQRTPAKAPKKAVDFLAASQCPDGGFPQDFGQPTCDGSVDATGLAVQALLASGRTAEATKALDWLAGRQQANGGFTSGVAVADKDHPVNANSTGNALAALRAGNRTAAGDKAAAYLTGLQIGCAGPAEQRGAITYDGTFTAGKAPRATAGALFGLARASLSTVSNKDVAAAAPTLDCTVPATSAPATAGPVLPVTGAPTGFLTATGAALLALGAVVVALARRRRSA